MIGMANGEAAGKATDGIWTFSGTAMVLQRAGEQALASGHTFLDHEALEGACRADGLGHDEVFASLRSLAGAALVEMHFVEPSRITLLRLTDGGIRYYLAEARPELAEVRRWLVDALRRGGVSWRGGEAVDLAASVKEPPLLVEVIMEDLQREGRVIFSRATGGRIRIHRLS